MTPKPPLPTRSRTCHACGAPLPASAPAGHCPRCLFRLASGPAPASTADREPEASGPIHYFGDYEIRGEIARGGMGIVYRARQISLNRPVALKMIAAGQLVTDAQVQRFRVEAEAAARLDHPNIVSVYEVGEFEGRHFYSMRRVEGGSLASRLAGFRPAPTESPRDRQRRVATLVRTVALALQHAHQRGVLHRDLKPSNILLDAGGEPHLADFGLARLDDSESDLTRTLAVIGTPHYMSPEQAAGRSRDLTTASDLFSLGAVFYELLAGQPAFSGDSTIAVLQAVRETTPRRPRSLEPTVEPDLETICLKCLEKDPARRYTSARALAEDLDRWLAGRPIDARPTGSLERVVLWSRRRPALAGLATALLAALVVGFVAVTWQSAGRRQALEEARRNLYVAQIQAAQQAWEKGDLSLARGLLRAQIPKPGEEDLRGFEWRHLGTLCEDPSRPLPFDLGDFGWVRAIAFSPDGELLALGTVNGDLQIRRLRDGAIHRSLRNRTAAGRTVGIFTAEFSRDGTHLLTAGDRTILLWNVRTGEKYREFTLTNTAVGVVTSAHFSPDGRRVAAGGYPGREVQLWDVASGGAVASYTGPVSDTRCNAFSADGRILAMDLGDGRITLVTLDATEAPRYLTGHQGAVGQFEFSPDGNLFASSDSHGNLRLWRTRDWQEVAVLGASATLVTTLSFSPDGQRLATGRRDGLIHVWDTRTLSLAGTLRGHLGWITRVAIHPEGRHLYSAGDDGVRVWDLPLPDGQPRLQTEPIVDFVEWDHTRVSADSRRIATLGTEAPHRRLWDATDGRLVALLPGNNHGAAFSPDARFFVAGDDRGHLCVWNADDGHAIVSLPVTSKVADVAFAAGQLFAASEAEESIRRWDARNWQPLPAWEGHEGGVAGLLASPDGRILAAWDRGGNVRQRNLADGTELPSIPIADAQPRMAYSPDGRWIAIHSSSRESDQLWDAQTGELRQAFEKPEHGNPLPVFSPDSRLIAVGGAQAKIEWWDVANRRRVAEIRWPGDGIVGRAWAMAFSPDGRSFVMCDNRGTVRFWNVPMRREVFVHTLTSGYGRLNFTPDGNTLVVHNIFRNNLLLRARPFAEVEASLTAPRGPALPPGR